MTDIIDLVIEDHHTVERLFDKLQAATEANEQAALFAQVKEALERHASAEEAILYPRVRTGPGAAEDHATLVAAHPDEDVAEGQAEVKDAIEEHDEIRQSLHEVDEHEAGTELFTLAVAQLVATTKHHVGVEETELLPDFRANSEASEREALGARFEEAKTKATVS